jgi:hypothetical protein
MSDCFHGMILAQVNEKGHCGYYRRDCTRVLARPWQSPHALPLLPLPLRPPFRKLAGLYPIVNFTEAKTS